VSRLAALSLFIALACTAPAEPPAGKSVETLLEEIRDEDPDVRLAAREGLRDSGEAAVPSLEKLAAAGDTPLARQARTLLRQIEFDRRAVRAAADGAAWFRWEKAGQPRAWIRLEAKKRSGGGWLLEETLKMGDATITQSAETDRDLVLQSIRSILTDGKTKKEITAVFRDDVCVYEEDGHKSEIPTAGPAFTEWTILRFAGSLLANPPHEPGIVVWDCVESDPASTNLRFPDPQVGAGPSGDVKVLPVKVEGLLSAYVKEDGTLSHGMRGEGSMLVPVAEKDVPADVRK